MAIVMSEQVSMFLGALVLGVVLGCLYDFFRITRLAFVFPAILILFEDLLFFIFSSIILFSYLLRASDGQVRYFVLAGVVLGWAGYYFTVGKLVMRCSESIIGLLRKVIGFILRPFRWIWKKFLCGFRWLENKQATWINKIKNGLKLRIVMMYNGKKKQERTGSAMAKGTTKTKSKNSLDGILKLLTIALLILLVIFLVRTKLSFAEMQAQLSDVQTQIEEQKLANKDMELSLRDSETYMERSAREKLDYALPDEQVFIDVSGTD